MNMDGRGTITVRFEVNDVLTFCGFGVKGNSAGKLVRKAQGWLSLFS